MASEQRGSGPRIHAMTVDAEDWVNATILQLTGKVLPPDEGIVRQCQRLLDLLAEAQCSATWFFLAELAERFPTLVRHVRDAGQEIAIHGLHHHQISTWSPERFRQTIAAAKDKLEQTSGACVYGYRAVDFGINAENWWVFDVLADLGFDYDSSVFPMKRPRYGTPTSPVLPYQVDTRSGRPILEIPVTVSRFPGFRLPFAGGGYFRTLPFWAVSMLMRKEARHSSVVFYLHPCEIDGESELPSLPDELTTAEGESIRRAFTIQRRGRKNGAAKLGRLLAQYRFASIREVFHDQLNQITRRDA